MNNFCEEDFRIIILDDLKKEGEYLERINKNYDKESFLDKSLLIQFISTSQKS